MSLPGNDTIVNLTRCKVYPGFFPDPFCDQFVRKIAFECVQGYGRQLIINRATLGAVTNYEAGGTLGLDPSDTDTATFSFRRIGDTVEVDAADITGSEGGQDQLELQVAMKRVSLVRQLATQIAAGDGTTPNLAGLPVATVSGQTFNPQAGTGTAPTLDDYHRLLTKVCATDGTVGAGPDALVMHPRTRRQLISRLEAAGCGPAFVDDPELGVPVLTFEGLPVYFSEQIATDEDATGAPGLGTLTSVYALKMHGPSAVRVLHEGGDPSDYGIVVEEVPFQLEESKRATTVRGFYCLFVPEEAAIARLKAVDISGFPD